MQLFQLKEPRLLQAAIEAEETCLCTHCHLLKKMHCIAHSLAKTTEVAATTEETTRAMINDKEDNRSNSSSNTTIPPTPRIG